MATHLLDELSKLIDPWDKILGVAAIVIPVLWNLVKRIPRVFDFFRVNADLHPFYSWKEVNELSRYYIETRGERIPQGDDEAGATKKSPEKISKLIPYFIHHEFRQHDDDQRFYLILGETGIGKTTFLINLYLRYSNKAGRGKFGIDLMSLWHPKTWERLIAYPEEKAKNTFLLLDSLDEDPKAVLDVNNRLNEIIDKVWFFRKVIICCNPQLFANRGKEPSDSGIPHIGTSSGSHRFQKIYLVPFTTEDIIRYIKKRFSILSFGNRKAAIELIRKSPSLMERPLLLSFIDDLIETKKKYEYAYEVYDSLIEKWIVRESNLIGTSSQSRLSFKSQLFVLSKAFAYAVFIKYQKTNDAFCLDENELKTLIESKQSDIDISVFRTKSLITRTETGLFKFAHFSILEFFLAQAAIDRDYHLDESKLEGFRNAQIFYKELFWNKEVLPFFAKSGGRVFTRMNNREVPISEILASGELEKVNNLFINGLQGLSLILLTPLKNILTLQAIDTPLESYESIANLRRLQTLNFENCNVSTVAPLKFLTDITSLHLKNGTIQEIEALAELNDLQYLNLENNQVADISPLKELKKLKRLNLVNNRISDFSPLSGLEKLSFLFVAGNPVEESQLEKLKVTLPGCDIDASKVDQPI